MNAKNPYLKIKENAINTATPEELTLMLYDGALKFANKSVIAIEKKDYTQANLYIQRTKDIIRELQLTLDMKYEISQQLMEVYAYLHSRLTQANIKKDIQILNECIEHIRLFRDTWKETIKIARVNQGFKSKV